MAAYELVDACAASGAVYQFQVYPFGTPFKEVPGLYIFCRPGAAQGEWSPVYVGQTHDLQSRVGTGLANHHQYTAAVLAGVTHIGVRGFQGREADRLAAEQDLIAGLAPRLNGRSYGGLLGGVG